MFGENLHKILHAQKISGKELSRITGISQSTISKFLSSDQEPKYSQIISISRAVQLPADLFMSSINPHPRINSPMINEYCMIRELYNDVGSHLHITTLYAFKDFTMNIPVVNNEALYIIVVIEGKTKSKLGPLNAGNFRISKGSDYKDLKVTIHKGTKTFIYIMHESLGDLVKSWSITFFESVEQQKRNF